MRSESTPHFFLKLNEASSYVRMRNTRLATLLIIYCMHLGRRLIVKFFRQAAKFLFLTKYHLFRDFVVFGSKDIYVFLKNVLKLNTRPVV